MENIAIVDVASPNFNVIASFALCYVVLAVEETHHGLHLPLLFFSSKAASLSRVSDKEAACSIPVVHWVPMLLPGKRKGSAQFVMVKDGGSQRLAHVKMRTPGSRTRRSESV